MANLFELQRKLGRQGSRKGVDLQEDLQGLMADASVELEKQLVKFDQELLEFRRDPRRLSREVRVIDTYFDRMVSLDLAKIRSLRKFELAVKLLERLIKLRREALLLPYGAVAPVFKQRESPGAKHVHFHSAGAIEGSVKRNSPERLDDPADS